MSTTQRFSDAIRVSHTNTRLRALSRHIALPFLLGGAILAVPYPVGAEPQEPAAHPGFHRLGEAQKHIDYCAGGWSGRLYFPTKDGEFIDAASPLVIILHGQGFTYQDYEQLQTLLAANFIASAALEYTDMSFAEDQLPKALNAHLAFLLDGQSICNPGNPLVDRLRSDIAIVGHSLGGGMAALSAQVLATAVGNPYGARMHAVVSLAPNPFVNNAEPYLVTPEHVPAFLAVLGTADDDQETNGPWQSAFLQYDGSGYLQNEYSHNGYWKNNFQKSMVYMNGIQHKDHSDLGNPNASAAVNTYVNAYLQWRFSPLAGIFDGNNRVYFTRQIPMPGLNYPGFTGLAAIQYSSESQRIVVDNFEDESLFFNSLGGSNVFSGFTSMQQGLSLDLVGKSPHWTHVLALEWNGVGGAPRAKFRIPQSGGGGIDCGICEDRQDSGAGDGTLALDRYLLLAFRVGASAEFPLDITFHYFDAGTNMIAAQTVGTTIPASLESDRIKSSMRTVTIPLSLWDKVDYSAVTSLEFTFKSPPGAVRAAQVDNIEFIVR